VKRDGRGLVIVIHGEDGAPVDVLGLLKGFVEVQELDLGRVRGPGPE
jgi:hypothetical protein